MANLYPVGAQELSVAADATAFTIAGILLEFSDVLPGDELCTSGASAPIATADDGAGHALAIPWPGPTITSSTSWWIRRVSDLRYSGFFMAQQAAVASARLAKIMAQGVQWACLSELNTPPGSPEEGDRHLIGTSPTGAWASNAGNVVDYLNGGWVFTVPRVGDVASIVTPGSFKLFNGSSWLGFVVAGGNLTSALNWAAAVDVASAATTDIGAAASNLVRITGTTTVTSLGTVAAGAARWVRFAGALTLTHNATSLILPGGASITTAAGDTMLAVSEGSGNWRVHHFQPAAGYARRVSSTAIGRLARFTNTAGGMGQSSMEEDGAGNVSMTGTLTAPGFTLASGGAGVNGYVAAVAGDATATGYFAFHHKDGTRRGYIGYASGGFIGVVGEGGYGWAFTGPVQFANAIRLASYTVATVPSAATAGAGAEIYVTNETGGAVTAFSDGANWRRVTDRAVIS